MAGKLSTCQRCPHWSQIHWCNPFSLRTLPYSAVCKSMEGLRYRSTTGRSPASPSHAPIQKAVRARKPASQAGVPVEGGFRLVVRLSSLDRFCELSPVRDQHRGRNTRVRVRVRVRGYQTTRFPCICHSTRRALTLD